MSTGLNFQTCTIINENVDRDSAKVLDSTGKVTNSWLFRGGEEKDNIQNEKVLRIKRDFTFKKSGIESVRYAEGFEMKPFNATINFGTFITDLGTIDQTIYCRLDLYLGLEGSEEFLYATPWIQKGMPLWVEFSVEKSDTATKLASRIAKEIKKNKNFLIDHELVLVYDNEKGVLTLQGADEYQRLNKISILKYDVKEDDTTVVESLEKGTAITLKERGINGFGTYDHIIRDLRLPTVENTYFSHIRQSETPILGAIYDQFIINYCDDSSNDGIQTVGNKLKSYTQHVFWVKRESADKAGELVTKFAEAIANVTEKNPIGDNANDITATEAKSVTTEKASDYEKTPKKESLFNKTK